jgi:hypothetical protein
VVRSKLVAALSAPSNDPRCMTGRNTFIWKGNNESHLQVVVVEVEQAIRVGALLDHLCHRRGLGSMYPHTQASTREEQVRSHAHNRGVQN